MSTEEIQPCCLKGFRWSGTPQGEEITVDLPITTSTSTDTRKISCYKSVPPSSSSPNNKRAILLIHDLFGWTFPNTRLLADHYALETNSTVYVPDFFDGLVMDSALIAQERWGELDLAGFREKNSREIREPEVFAWARYLRNQQGHEKVGAVGFCFGGWACFRLAAREHEEKGQKLVDCIAPGHPTWATEKDVDETSPNVGVQVLSTEIDMVFSKEMKAYTWNKLQENGVPFEWVHFPGSRHGALVRGDENVAGERAAMVRAKDKVVAFMGEWLGTD